MILIQYTTTKRGADMETNENSRKAGSPELTGREALTQRADFSEVIKRSKRSGRYRILFIFIVLAICLSLFSTGWDPPALAEVPAEVTATNPGDTDPIDDAMVFRDDELLLNEVQNMVISFRVDAPLSDDLQQWKYEDGYYIFDPQNLEDPKPVSAGAAGRIGDPGHDHLVLAMMTPDGKTRVRLHDPLAGVSAPPLHEIVLRGAASITTPDHRYLDVAVGDLDNFVDENGYYHEEIIVVRSALYGIAGEAVMVDVLDYNFNILASYDFAGAYRDVAVTLGDFNNDHKKEIAIAMVLPAASGNFFVVKTGKLTEAAGQYALVFNSTSANLIRDGYTVDITCGDFRGKGEQHIIASGGASFYVFMTDAALNLVLKHTQATDLTSSGDLRTKVRLVPGLFKFDAPNGYDVNRRQLAAVAMRRTTAKLWLQFEIFDMNDTYQLVTAGPTSVNLDTASRDYKEFEVSAAAGNFVGHGQNGDATSPVMQLAVDGMGYIDEQNNNNVWVKDVWKVSPDLKTVTETGYFGGIYHSSYFYTSHLALAIDADGDSWRLGPPVQVVMDGVVKMEGTIQEPPKHVDYLPVDPAHPEGEWEVFNIGGYDEFNVEMSYTDGSSLKSTTTTTKSYDIGGAASLEANAEFKGGIPVICKGKADAYGKLKASYQYEHSTADIDPYYYSKDAKVTRETNRADNVGGRIQHVDAWMYPIYGYENPDPENPCGWYQVIIPGTPETDQPFSGSGFNWDEYQPFHENHNILSYPDYTKYVTWDPALDPDTNPIPVWPDDVGAYYDPVDDTKYQDLLNKSYMGPFIYDGNKETLELTFTETSSHTDVTKHMNTFTEKAEIAVKTTAKVKVPLIGQAKMNIMGDVSFNSKQSWGKTTVGTQESSGSKGLTITKPQAPEDNKAYGFKSAVYIDEGGTFKVAHSVDPLASDRSRNWWISQYGTKADPALNLPFRYTHHEPYGEYRVEYWTVSEDFDRNYMRGFLLRESEPNPVGGENELLPGPIYDGEVVLLCARIYNYSLYQDTGPFDVKFYYGLWDSHAGQLVPGHTWETKPEMTVRVDNLNGTTVQDGTSMMEVRVPWNTTGLSQVAQSYYGYRFMVTLDEENEVNEIHEGWTDAERTEIMPAGNNVGTFPWGNVVPVAGAVTQTADVPLQDLPDWARKLMAENPSARIVFSPEGNHDEDVNLSGDALSIGAGEEFKSGGAILVKKGQKVELRTHIRTESHHEHNFLVILYDGHPDKKGKIIGMRSARGLPEGDSYIRAIWTPDTEGKHDIWAHVIGDLRYADRQNAWDSLRVVVTPPQAGGRK